MFLLTLKLQIILVFHILNMFSVILSETTVTPLPSLCDDVYIHSADRLPNNTYRVYREKYYWELKNLPTTVAQVDGPHPLPFLDMWPFNASTSVVTIVGGEFNGYTVQVRSDGNYKMWTPEGKLHKNGTWPQTSYGHHWELFCDGNLDNKGYPLIIGFKGKDFEYFTINKTKTMFHSVNKTDGSGKLIENFPELVIAAFVFPKDPLVPSKDPTIPYNVYLFQPDRYCFRPIRGVTEKSGCPEWRNNKELFGCTNATAPPVTAEMVSSGLNTTESISSGTDLANTDQTSGTIDQKDGNTEAIGETDSTPSDTSPREQSEVGTDDGSGGMFWIIVIIIAALLLALIAIAVIIFFVMQGSPPKESAKGDTSPATAAAPTAGAGAQTPAATGAGGEGMFSVLNKTDIN